MSVPLAVRSANGPWDIILSVEGESMGFRTQELAQVRQISSLAPNIRVGGESAYSNEAFSQLIINGFDAGSDQELFEAGDKRSQWSDGKVALGTEGRVTLASEWEESDPSVDVMGPAIVDFNPAAAPQPWICMATTNMRAYNTTTGVWGDVLPSATRTGMRIFASEQYMFFGFTSSGTKYFYRWDGAALGAGLTACLGYADCIGWYKEKLYKSVDHNLYAATNNNGSAFGSAIPVGFDTSPITDLYEHAGLLFVAKPEGLFVYDELDVYKILDANVTKTTNNFRGMAEYLGALYVGWQGALYKGVVSTTTKMTSTDITPRMKGSDAKERYGHGSPVKIVGGPRKMFIGLTGGEGVYPEVLSYNGLGFQQVYRGESGSTLTALGYSREMNWLIINDGSTRIKKMLNTGDAEYPDYVSSGEFWTPAFDGGYPAELKLWRSITIEAEDCNALNYVTVSYRTDGGDWTEIGSIVEDGQQELLLDASNGHVASRKIEFKFVLTRGDVSTTTPKMKMPMIVRVMVSPLAIDAYHETIILDIEQELWGGYGKVGEDAGYTLSQMRQFLYMARNSPYPLTRIDEEGTIYSLKITDLSQSGERILTSPAMRSKWNMAVRYLDMRPGAARQANQQSLNVTEGTLSASLFDWSAFTAFGTGKIGLSTCSG